jgi:hypothetical protein
VAVHWFRGSDVSILAIIPGETGESARRTVRGPRLSQLECLAIVIDSPDPLAKNRWRAR